MWGQKLKVWILCSALVILHVTFSVLSFGPFDPGGRSGGVLVKENRGVLVKETKILLEPSSCSISDLGIILVHSHAANFDLRASQRKSKKLSESENLKFVFILFQSPSVEATKLVAEHAIHGDILLCDAAESYHSLVYKHIIGLLWTQLNCPHVKYVIKMDDDIYVDFPGLVSVVGKNMVHSSMWMMGLLQIKLPILRNKMSKWAVSEEDFSGHFYPDFLSGWCYVSTPEAVRGILSIVDNEDLFWIDDVWVTGVLAGRAGVELISLNLYYTVYSGHLSCCAADTSLLCPYLAAPSDGDSLLIEQAASQASNCRAGRKDCVKRRTKEQSLLTNCQITNPLFLPSSRVFAEVIVV